ncbi:sulfatase [Lignipirellula cremea]|uniref:Arylsulfatase n=1 Tax=Lignipirellula cremea TaxID=2528010 RepID=A0A518DNE0_9BACT|nr:sulfatase [Lignipirellula cremea]QDU93352.1 Arylsulfatase [Lignipirellula cremea]
MVRLLPCVLLLLLSGSATAAETRPPNLLFILIDDLGWSDLACQGNKLVETPHVDRLARQGMRFTDAYAAAPVCSPTRAAIMTGKSPARLHLTNHTPDRASFTPDHSRLLPAEMLDHLPSEEVTIAERLKTAGYATGFLGKWHLSGDGRGKPEFEPTAQGFDLNVGGCGYGGPPTFFDPYRIPNLPDRQAGEYLPDRLADEAVQFMQAHRDQPFALFLWNYTVHWPMEAPDALLAKYADRKGPGLNDTRYGAMIEAMDAAVGKVLAELDQLDLTDQTLVIFNSDNGGFGGVSDNRPLRAAKGHLYEGGIRVPLIIRWPGHVAAGSVSHTPVVSMDFFPTLAAVAGLPAESQADLDGVNLLPLLQGEKFTRGPICFHFPNFAWHRSNRLGGAIRSGDWKLIERFDDNSLELYNLAEDLGERKNLADAMPRQAKSLQQQLARWREQTNAAMPRPREPASR